MAGYNDKALVPATQQGISPGGNNILRDPFYQLALSERGNGLSAVSPPRSLALASPLMSRPMEVGGNFIIRSVPTSNGSIAGNVILRLTPPLQNLPPGPMSPIRIGEIFDRSYGESSIQGDGICEQNEPSFASSFGSNNRSTSRPPAGITPLSRTPERPGVRTPELNISNRSGLEGVFQPSFTSFSEPASQNDQVPYAPLQQATRNSPQMSPPNLIQFSPNTSPPNLMQFSPNMSPPNLIQFSPNTTAGSPRLPEDNIRTPPTRQVLCGQNLNRSYASNVSGGQVSTGRKNYNDTFSTINSPLDASNRSGLLGVYQPSINSNSAESQSYYVPMISTPPEGYRNSPQMTPPNRMQVSPNSTAGSPTPPKDNFCTPTRRQVPLNRSNASNISGGQEGAGRKNYNDTFSTINSPSDASNRSGLQGDYVPSFNSNSAESQSFYEPMISTPPEGYRNSPQMTPPNRMQVSPNSTAGSPSLPGNNSCTPPRRQVPFGENLNRSNAFNVSGGQEGTGAKNYNDTFSTIGYPLDASIGLEGAYRPSFNSTSESDDQSYDNMMSTPPQGTRNSPQMTPPNRMQVSPNSTAGSPTLPKDNFRTPPRRQVTCGENLNRSNASNISGGQGGTGRKNYNDTFSTIGYPVDASIGLQGDYRPSFNSNSAESQSFYEPMISTPPEGYRNSPQMTPPNRMQVSPNSTAGSPTLPKDNFCTPTRRQVPLNRSNASNISGGQEGAGRKNYNDTFSTINSPSDASNRSGLQGDYVPSFNSNSAESQSYYEPMISTPPEGYRNSPQMTPPNRMQVSPNSTAGSPSLPENNSCTPPRRQVPFGENLNRSNAFNVSGGQGGTGAKNYNDTFSTIGYPLDASIGLEGAYRPSFNSTSESDNQSYDNMMSTF